MKRILILSLTLIFAFVGLVYAASPNGEYKGKPVVQVTLDGKEVQPDSVPGYLDGSSTMVPLGMLRKFGITVEWNQKTLTANVKMPPPRIVPVLIQSQLEELSKAVYLITTAPTTEYKNGKGGTAFKVGDYMITASHVASDASYAQVLSQMVTKYDFVNKTTDVMGFKLTAGDSLPYSTAELQPGDPVYSISYPAGKKTVTEGVVKFILPLTNGNKQIVHTALTDDGSSGGPIFNGRGEVIGVSVEVFEHEGESTSFAIPISYAVDEMKSLQ